MQTYCTSADKKDHVIYQSRTLEAFFKTAIKQFPVLLLTGARQVGKTTFLRYVSKDERSYVTLDDPLVLNLARKDPALFMQRSEICWNPITRMLPNDW